MKHISLPKSLNLPHLEAFESEKILLIGAGGGYDYVGAFPLQYALYKRGKTPVILDIEPTFGKTGVKPLFDGLNKRIQEMNVTTLIAVDGGVDALMRGDERDGGTLLEDSITLAAASKLDLPHKILACIGFGTESEEGLCHYRALENIADLMAQTAFLGSCSLAPSQAEFAFYKKRAEEAWQGKRQSHIHTRIIPAVLGEFEEQTMYDDIDARMVSSKRSPFVNPLMGIYWFFDLDTVASRNLLVPHFLETNTRTDAMMMYRQFLNQQGTVRESRSLPL